MQFWPASNRIHWQPKGVVLIVVPWNYPLFLTAGPLTAALADNLLGALAIAYSP